MTEQSDSLHPWFCNGDRLFRNTAVIKVSVSNHRPFREKVHIYFFFSSGTVKLSRGKRELWLLCTPLAYTDPAAEWKCFDATSEEEEEPCDKVCENADARVGFKSDGWRHVGLPMSKWKKKRRTDATKNERTRKISIKIVPWIIMQWDFVIIISLPPTTEIQKGT